MAEKGGRKRDTVKRERDKGEERDQGIDTNRHKLRLPSSGETKCP